jgi:hypothetical protein
MRELCSLFSVTLVPVAAIVGFLVGQEGSDVDMPLGLPFIRCLSIMDDVVYPKDRADFALSDGIIRLLCADPLA